MVDFLLTVLSILRVVCEDISLCFLQIFHATMRLKIHPSYFSFEFTGRWLFNGCGQMPAFQE